MNKFDYVNHIIQGISSSTGDNFQLKVGEILKVYYQSKHKTYEMPNSYGGDKKNDGWVKEDALFYQIYAPTAIRKNFKKEIQKKFEEDLKKLFCLVYKENRWGGNIKKFIFIVNTFDINLPEDSERFYDNLVNELKNEYKCDFKYKLTNTDYIKDILELEDIELLERISARLKIHNFYYDPVTEKSIMDLILNVANMSMKKNISLVSESSYERISSVKKLKLIIYLLIKIKLKKSYLI